MLAIENHEQPHKPKNGASIRSHRFFLRVDLDLRARTPSLPCLRNPTSPR
jgi:hypothetical protein